MDNNTFILSKKVINISLIMIAIGLISLAYGYFGGLGAGRIAANILMNTFYFLGIALIGLFFVAVHAIAESGWQVSVQRIGEAMSRFIPVGESSCWPCFHWVVYLRFTNGRIPNISMPYYSKKWVI